MTVRTSAWPTRLFYAARFFYGGWFLFHGANYWLHYFPEKSFAPGAHGFIPDLIKLHIFDVVKILEIVIGAALLADLFVPLAIVAAFPLTFVIAQLNFMKHDLFGACVGTIIIALNCFMAVGHLDRYLPMLTARAGAPSLRGVNALLGDRAPPMLQAARLRPGMHVMAILLGLAAPAALTYASIYFAKPAPPPMNEAPPTK